MSNETVSSKCNEVHCREISRGMYGIAIEFTVGGVTMRGVINTAFSGREYLTDDEAKY